jgi:imidazolonepropionase-like amidohydrolase
LYRSFKSWPNDTFFSRDITVVYWITIHAARVLDGKGAIITDAVVTVQGDHITSVGTTIGTLAPNFAADIIAVPGDPLKNIDAVKNVSFVMKGGQVYKK